MQWVSTLPEIWGKNLNESCDLATLQVKTLGLVPYPLSTPSIYQSITEPYSVSVSPDAAISITFGFVSSLLGVISVFTSYLTLRAMTVDHGTNSITSMYCCPYS